MSRPLGLRGSLQKGAASKTTEKCDGFERCDDGADERGCPTFACKSGETVSAQKKCDGSDDCDDSSDESGCPTCRCEDGTTILTVDKCDGFEDCEDASDEVGCKKRDFELMCLNGPDGATRPGGIILID